MVMVSENEDAELWCVIDAYPLSSEHVTWRKPGFPLDTRTTRSFINNTSYLTVRGVTRKDMGQFFCVADNGLGNETSRAVFLAVKRKFRFFLSLKSENLICTGDSDSTIYRLRTGLVLDLLHRVLLLLSLNS